jgi:hypothetical protein
MQANSPHYVLWSLSGPEGSTYIYLLFYESISYSMYFKHFLILIPFIYQGSVLMFSF